MGEIPRPQNFRKLILNQTDLTPEQSKTLDVLAKSSIDEFNDLINQLASDLDNLDWFLAPILSRDPYLSKFFENYCFIKLVGHFLNEYENLTIVTPSKALFKLLKSKGLNVTLDTKRKLQSRQKEVFKNLVSILYTCVLFLWNQKRDRRVKTDNNLVLIDTFILNSMFSSNGFKDRYYNNILDLANEEVKSNIIFLGEFLNLKSGLRKRIKTIGKSEYNFIYKFDYLKLRDYVFAITSVFRILPYLNRIGIPTQDGYDLRYLILDEIVRGLFNYSQFSGLLNYRFIKRLKDSKIGLDLVIDWHENQPIDKGLIYGVRKYYPSVKIKGYQGFVVSYDFNIHLDPISWEFERGTAPNTMVYVGEGIKDNRKSNHVSLKLDVGPSFRFKKPEAHNFKKKYILFALPASISESGKLIQLAMQLSSKFKDNQYIIGIKPHPLNDILKFSHSYKEFSNSQIEILTESFNKTLSSSKVLISSASSTCFEAVLEGVPVIITANNQGITQNPIPLNYDTNCYTIVYSLDEMLSALRRLLELDEAYLRNLGQSQRNVFFEPVNSKTVEKFLQSKK